MLYLIAQVQFSQKIGVFKQIIIVDNVISNGINELFGYLNALNVTVHQNV